MTFGFNWDDTSTANQMINASTRLSNIGYNSSEFIDCTASTAYSVLPYGWVFVASSHASAGLLAFRSNGEDSILYADYPYTLVDYDRELSGLSYNALSSTRLVIYGGCYTGATSTTFGNLVDMTLSKGAHACFGWLGLVISSDLSNWFSEFFYLCETENKSVADIIVMVQNQLEDNSQVVSASIFGIHDGNSCNSVIV